jgi:hypothetical protein
VRVSRRGGIDDTDPRARAVQLRIFRGMTPAQKMALVDDAVAFTQEVALAGLRRRYPDAGPAEIRRRLMGLMLGEELASRAFGPLPG